MAQTHHYLFDTATGFNDSTGSDNFSNAFGTIDASGKINQGFRFEYLTMMPTSTANNLLPTSGAFTIAFWMNENFGGYYLKLFNIGDMNVGLLGKDNELSVEQTGSGGFYLQKSGGSYAHYIISTNGSGTWTVYKNNVSQALTGTSTWTPSATTYNSTSDFSFNGGSNGDPVFIDDLRIYNEVIDGTERSFIYNSGSGTQSDSGGGGGGSATQLSVLTQPTRSYSTKSIATQPVINLLTSGGSVDGSATNTVFANVVSGAGTIGGSTSVSATSGVATFSGLSVAGFGAIGLGFTASGLTAAYSTFFNVDPPVPIMPQRTETSGYVPVSGDLRVGELFVNIPDQKGYVKKVNGTIATVWQPSALTSGSIGSGLLANNSVVSGSIASGQIGVNHLISGLITTLTLGSGQVTSGSISSGSISNFKIASGAIISGHIGNNAVVSGSIASGQIGTNHLSNAIIVSGSVASGQIGRMHLSSGAINSGHLANSSVVSGSIASGSINTYHIGSTTAPISGHILQLNGTTLQYNAPASVSIVSGSITSGMLANNSVVSGSIASGQIGRYHLSNNSVWSGHISSSEVGSVHLNSGAAIGNLLSGSIGSGLLANNSVVSGSIASGQIGINHLISGLITTLTLGSGQVTSGAIASGQVGQFKLSSGAVNSGHIGNNAVVSGSIASGQIGTNHLSNNSVVSGSIASGQIGVNHLISGLITTLTLGSGQVTSGSISSGSISNFKIASGAILSGHVGNNAVVSGSIASGQIGTNHLSNNSVVSGNIASGQIGVNHLISGLITTLTLGSGQVTSGSIASGSISNFKIASGAILSGHIGDNSVVSGSVASGQIGTNHLANAIIVSGSVASGQIGRMHLSSGAINSGHLANASVVSGSIASGSINTYHIGSTTSPISGYVLQINGTTLQYNTPPSVPVASGQITSGMIGNNTIVSGSISSGLLQKNVWTSLDTQVTTGNNFTVPLDMTLPSSASWQAVAYGNGRYVALTTGSTAAYSSDGQNWTSNTLSAATYSDIAYGTNTGLFQAVTNGTGATYYSTDGINFSSQTQPVSVLTRVKYGNGVFLALGTSTQGAISNSSLSFSSLTLPSPDFMNNWTDLEFGNKTWVIIQGSTTASSTIYVSKDNGTNWTSKTLPASINQYSIAYGFGRFIITGATNATYYYSDDDGDTWQSVATGVTAASWRVKYDAGKFHLIPASGTAAYIIQVERGATAVTSNTLPTSATWSYIGAGNGGKVIILPSGSATGQYIGGLGNYNFVSQYASEIDNVNIGAKQPRIGNFLNINVNTINVTSGIAGNFLTSGVVRSGAIASGQIGQFHLSDNSVRSGAIASGQVGRFQHADNSVTSGAIASGQVGQFQHADNSVFSGNIASGQVGQFHLSDSSVRNGAIASGQISNFKMASGAILSGHIGNNAVVSGSIGSGQISRFHLANESVFSGNIGSGQIGPVHLNQIIPNNVQPKTNNFRLSVQSGVAITSTDQSAQSTLYLVPHTGNQIALYDGTNWKTSIASGAVVSLTITGLTSGRPYDIFAYDNSGVPALEFGTVWTTVNARADAIQIVDGVALKSGTLTRRLIGTILPTAPTTTNDTLNQRYVNNYDNQVSRQLFKTDATNHTYASTSPRIWNLTSGNQIQYVASRAGIAGNVGMQTASRTSTGASFARTQITGGADQLPSTNLGVATLSVSGAILQYMTAPSATTTSVLGYNFFYPAESCTTAGATGTFNAVDLFGEIKG